MATCKLHVQKPLEMSAIDLFDGNAPMLVLLGHFNGLVHCFISPRPLGLLRTYEGTQSEVEQTEDGAGGMTSQELPVARTTVQGYRVGQVHKSIHKISREGLRLLVEQNALRIITICRLF